MLNALERNLPKTEQDRIAFERKSENVRVERQHLDDFHAEMSADANLFSQEPNMSDSGKIRRHTRPRNKNNTTKEKELIELTTLFSASAVSDIFRNLLNGTYDYLAALAGTPYAAASTASTKAQAKNIDPRYAYEDNNFAFEFTKVSEQTAREMEIQAEIINAKVEAMEATPHLDRKHELARQVVSLAEEFRMREHPLTRAFVHELEAVEIMESKFNPDGGGVLCDAEVCVVRMKCSPADGRAIKRTISDVFNLDPAEIALTQAERVIVEVAKPAPIAPGLHLT